MPARKQLEESLKIEHKDEQTRQLAITEGTARLEVLGARYDAGLDRKEKTIIEKNNKLLPTDKPGLGVDLDFDKVNKYKITL